MDRRALKGSRMRNWLALLLMAAAALAAGRTQAAQADAFQPSAAVLRVR
jgi:hypothetical protein